MKKLAMIAVLAVTAAGQATTARAGTAGYAYALDVTQPPDFNASSNVVCMAAEDGDRLKLTTPNAAFTLDYPSNTWIGYANGRRKASSASYMRAGSGGITYLFSGMPTVSQAVVRQDEAVGLNAVLLDSNDQAEPLPIAWDPIATDATAMQPAATITGTVTVSAPAMFSWPLRLCFFFPDAPSLSGPMEHAGNRTCSTYNDKLLFNADKL